VESATPACFGLAAAAACCGCACTECHCFCGSGCSLDDGEAEENPYLGSRSARSRRSASVAPTGAGGPTSVLISLAALLIRVLDVL
jgi:hypothetical protein